MIVYSKDFIKSFQYVNDPRDIPNELKNFKLLITKCNYILEHLNIVCQEGDIWKLSDKEIDEEKLLLKNLNSIFNKITDENYEILLNELTRLEKINNKNIINRSIDILISNIKSNQVFCDTYAKLCKDIDKKNLWEYTEENKIMYFSDVLIEKLHKEFINIVDNECRIKDYEYLKTIEDEEEKYEEEIKIKKKYNGIILLLGHLFNYNIIKPKILDLILKYLINPLGEEDNLPDKWNLDFLYNLLIAVQKNISWNRQAKIIEIIKFIAVDKNLSNRVRFRFMDIVEKIK